MTTDDRQPPGPADQESPPPMPAWVKYLLLAVLAVIGLVLLVMLVVGGDHGPGRHAGGHRAGTPIAHGTIL